MENEIQTKYALIIATLFIAASVLGCFSPPVQASGNVTILSHSSFYDSLDNLWVVGEVENIGDTATRFTRITATFYNVSAEVVAEKFGYTNLDILLPGRKSSFAVLLLEEYGSLKVHNYTLTVSWSDYTEGKPLGLEILSNSSSIDGMGYMHVTGVIKNTGATTANSTEVIATFYNTDGVVIGRAYNNSEPTDLLPNQTASFDVRLIYTQQVGLVASYSLTAESTQYAIIPEFWSALIMPLLMMTTLLVAILMKKEKTYRNAKRKN